MTRRKRARPDGAERPAERPDVGRAEALRLKALEAAEHPGAPHSSTPHSSTQHPHNRCPRAPAHPPAALPHAVPSRAGTPPTDTTTQPNIAASTTSAAPSPSHPPTRPAATSPSVASTATPSPKAPSPGAALGLRLAADLSPEQWAVGAACSRSTAYVEERSGDAKRDGSEWLGPAFLAVVHLKGEPWLAALTPLLAAVAVERILTELHPDAEDVWRAALPDCDIFENPVDPREHFVASWQKVSEPHPLPVWDLARWAAERSPLTSPLLSEKVAIIAALAYWLQRATGGTFSLSCRQAGKFAGIDFGDAAKHLRLLVAEGVLQEVEKGSQATGLASTYRWRAPVEVPVEVRVEVAVEPAESRLAMRRKRGSRARRCKS